MPTTHTIRHLVIWLLCFGLGLPILAERPAIHPFLKPLVEQPSSEIHPRLRSSMAGFREHRRIGNREALSLHLRTTASRQDLEELGLRVRTFNNGRATVTALPEHLAVLAKRPDVTSITLPRPVFPNLENSIRDIGVETLRSESSGTFSGATGSGVVVGVVDSGIDVDHPNFLDASGNSRIAYLWDQTTGEYCTAADIDAGTCLQEDDPDAFGHGTHVTGIAAGTGAAADSDGDTYTHVGVAPEATIVFVKTDWSTASIIDGIHYIFDRADDLGMPAVVNLSLGTQLGAHDGTSDMEEEIDDLVTAQDGRAVVVSAGNSRDDEIHAEIFSSAGTSTLGPDLSVSSYTASAGSNNDYIYMVGYYPDGDDLTVHLWSPSGLYDSKTLNTSPFGSPCTVFSDTSDGYVYLCNNYVSQLGDSTADNEILILIVDDSSTRPPASGTWSLSLTGNTVAGNGEVDFWTVSYLGGSSSNAVWSTHVDDSETLGIPATSREAITVGAHVTRTCWEDYTGTSQSYSSSYDLGELAPFSSAGPTRDDRAKPDISAPGMGIISALAHEVESDIIGAGYGSIVVTSDYLLMQGTSQAAPHVAGAVALLLEEDPTYSNADLKSLLSGAAREDAYTEPYEETPAGVLVPLGVTANYSFGSGKLDLGSWGYTDPYESNDTLGQAYGILSGQVLNGYIEHADDIDLFHLDALASGDTVDIELTGLPEDYLLRLQRSLSIGSCGGKVAMNVTSSNNSGTADESISHTAGLFTGKYIRVASSAGAYDAASSYTLQAMLTRPETSGVHNSIATAQELPEFIEMDVSGDLSVAFEQDYYKFVGKGAVAVSTSPSRQIRLLNGSGTILASGTGSVSYSPGFGLLTEQTYYVRVSGLAGAYTLTLER